MIKKLILENNFIGYKPQKNFENLYKTSIVETINQAFNNVADKINPNIILKIPKLEFKFRVEGKFNQTTTILKISNSLMEQLEDILIQMIQNKNVPDIKVDFVNIKIAEDELIKHFLSNGNLPWWYNSANFQNINSLILKRANTNVLHLTELIDSEKTDDIKNSLIRLLQILPQNTLNELIASITFAPDKTKNQTKILSVLTSINKNPDKEPIPVLAELLSKSIAAKNDDTIINLKNDLNSFPSEILASLLIHYFSLGYVPDWSKNLISFLQKSNKLNSDTDCIVHIINYISSKNYENVKTAVSTILQVNSVVSFIIYNQPETIFQALIILLFSKKYNILKRAIVNIPDSDKYETPINVAILKNNSKLINLLEVAPFNENSSAFSEIKDLLSSEINNFLPVNTRITSLLQTKSGSEAISKVEFQKFVATSSKQFLTQLLSSNNTAFYFINYFPKNVINAIFQKIDTEKYQYFSKLKIEFDVITFYINSAFKQFNKPTQTETDTTINQEISHEVMEQLQQLYKTSENISENTASAFYSAYYMLAANYFINVNITDQKFANQSINLYINILHTSQKFYNASVFFFTMLRIIPSDKTKLLQNIINQSAELKSKFVASQKFKSVSALSIITNKLRYRIAGFFKKRGYQNTSIEKQAFSQKNNTQTQFQQLYYYLQNGSLNWISPFSNINELCNYLYSNAQEISRLYGNELYIILQNYYAKIRFNNLPNNDLVQLITKLIQPQKSTDTDLLAKQFNKDNNTEILNLLKTENENKQYEDLINDKIDWLQKKHEYDEIFIENTGLVLVCAFLSNMFTRLGYLEKKEKKNVFTSENVQQRAIYLTQFLVTGTENHHESNLVLNKIICGWEIQRPLVPPVQLTDNEKKEAEMMLNAIIKHWTILGNTSIAGLRQGFLNRNGMLAFKDKNVTIKAEQKGIDILVTKIPWSYQTIKFSWNNYIIFVDWNA